MDKKEHKKTEDRKNESEKPPRWENEVPQFRLVKKSGK